MARLDHIAVSAETLDAGADGLSALLGVPLEPGGRHPHMGTHNRLLSLGPEEYLEVIAIDPEAAPPGQPRWFRLDGFSGPPRLTNWIARTDDLAASLAAAPPGAGSPVDLARGDYRWRFGVTADGRLPFDDCFPALIEWQGTAHPATALPDRGCRLRALELHHPQAAALARALPLADRRITILPGAARLRALLSTPAGERWLE
ncbi:MAG: hypothetical protein RLZZ528_1287 [Pseudomonadota bacterium]|jgi:hypothetical protein